MVESSPQDADERTDLDPELLDKSVGSDAPIVSVTVRDAVVDHPPGFLETPAHIQEALDKERAARSTDRG